MLLPNLFIPLDLHLTESYPKPSSGAIFKEFFPNCNAVDPKKLSNVIQFPAMTH